jgi:hypothetical protein
MHLDVVSPFGHGHFEHWSMRHRYNHVHLRLHLNCECNRPSMRAVRSASAIAVRRRKDKK